MTPQELKTSVLQLAYQGLLAPQLESEGTGEQLLEEIQKKNPKLKKRTKIERDFNVFPFDIPSSWKWVSISDISVTSLGKTLNGEKDGGMVVPYLCSINVYWEGINLSKVKNARFSESEREKYALQKGDLLMCEGGDAGRCAIWKSDQEMYYQNALHRIRFEKPLDVRFFFHLFWLYKTNGLIKKYSKGETIQHLVQNSLYSIPIPLPPLPEQKRIVEKIESLMPLVDEYERLWNELKSLNRDFPADLEKSVLQIAIKGKLVEQRSTEGTGEELFALIQNEKKELIKKKLIKKEKPFSTNKEYSEYPFDIPPSWKFVRFGELMINRDSERIPVSIADRTKRTKIYDYYGASGPIDKIDSYLFDKELLLIGEDGANLLSRSTPIAFLAKGKYWVNNHAHVLDGCCGLNLKFISYCINAISLAPYVTGTAQPKMNQENMNAIWIPLPPLAEQERIVAKLDETISIIQTLKSISGVAR